MKNNIAKNVLHVIKDEELFNIVVPNPYGEAPDQETFPVIDSDIKAVIFEGYSDEADYAAILEDRTKRKKDPFYNLRKMKEE